MTSAFLALQLWLGRKASEFDYVVVPFDQILEVVHGGGYQGRRVDAGLVIHEGQLTYGDQNLELVVDLGRWWLDQTGLPLPLGANALRKDLQPQAIADVNRLLRESIVYGLEHREEALQYALGYGRGLDPGMADRFVGMYVNDWTLDFGPRGREAVAQFLARAYECGLVPQRVVPEFVI